MSSWSDRITSSSVFSTSGRILPLFEEANSRVPTTPEMVESWARAQQIGDSVVSVLAELDPALTHPSHLSSLESYTQQFVSELQAFAQDGNQNRITTLNQIGDNIVGLLPSFTRPITVPGREEAMAAVRRTREAAFEAIDRLNSREDTLSRQLDELSAKAADLLSDISSQKGRLDAAIAQFQQQFSQAEESRRGQFSTSEQTRHSESSAAMAERISLWEDFLRQAKEERAQLATDVRVEQQGLKEKALADGAQIIKSLESDKERATRIVGIISENGMIHGYRRVANEERAAAVVWHRIAGAAMLGLIGFAVFAFWETLGQSFNWGTFGGRAFVALAFGVLAAYAARQADKHEEVERRSRRLELELAALDPFLEPLPEQTRYQIKTQMADRLFGHSEPVAPIVSGETTGSVIDLLKLAIQGLSKK